MRNKMRYGYKRICIIKIKKRLKMHKRYNAI